MRRQSAPLIHAMGGWSGHCGDEKNFLPLPRIEPLIIKPIECDVCDINTFCKNYNLGAI